MGLRTPDASRWTFLTNHAHVLLCLVQTPGVTLRDVALRVGVTERAVQRIVHDLEGAGYLERRRTGRQNEYDIDVSLPLRHPVEAHRTVEALVELASPAPDRARRRPTSRHGTQARPSVGRG